MSNIKHKLFKVKVLNNDKKDFDDKALISINDFLIESNNVYVNHSVTTITEDIEKYGQINTICKEIVISLIYKDLLDSELSLSNATKKNKALVKKQIIDDSDFPEPETETDFEKEIEKIRNPPAIDTIITPIRIGSRNK